MKKFLFMSAITALVLGVSIDSRGLLALSFIFMVFLILEIGQSKEERELKDWHKEVKEKAVNDMEDWHEVDYNKWEKDSINENLN